MKFLPYVSHHVTAEDVAAVAKVLASDRLTQGTTVDELENEIAYRLGAHGVVACSSGTAALHLAMMAMGVKPGDHVVTTPMTFCATANAVLFCGGKPLFADVRAEDLNIDPACVEDYLAHHTPKPVGILAMHYAGNPCDMKALRELADKYRVWLVEDACHAFGARYPTGMPVGGQYADLSCWSFHPAKHIAAGEGGAVSVPGRRANLLDPIRSLRDHGRDSLGAMQRLGYNYRMDEMSAALALSQLGRIDEKLLKLKELEQALAQVLPTELLASRLVHADGSARHLFVIRVKDRPKFRGACGSLSVGTQVHYQPVYLHPYYAKLGYREGLCPVVERAWTEIVSLPFFAEMTAGNVKAVGMAAKVGIA